MSVNDNARELVNLARRIEELENRAGHADADGEGNRFAGEGSEENEVEDVDDEEEEHDDNEDNDDEARAPEWPEYYWDKVVDRDDHGEVARSGVHSNWRRTGAAESVKKKEDLSLEDALKKLEEDKEAMKKRIKQAKQKGGKRRKKKTRRKTKRVLRNTNNKTCKSRKMTSCCPHMMPVNGKYMATTKKHNLKYKGKTYVIKTCCPACAMSMKTMAKGNPTKFAKTYISRTEKNALVLKNRHTGKVVQRASVKRLKTVRKKKRSTKRRSYKSKK